MTEVFEDLEALDDEIAALETALGGAREMSSAFQGELAAMRQTLLYTGREVDSLSKRIGSGLRRAFDGLVFDGMRLSDALREVGRAMSRAAYDTAMKPVQDGLGGAIAEGMNALVSGLLPFEKGAPFSQGRVQPFARGGVVSGPTYFPMRGGVGLMGEAGPEAILPLARGPDGRLGVESRSAGRAVQVTVNVTTPDVEGFRRSQSQIAAQVSRALARGARNR
ncbi:phage tail tape measure protein [Rhodovulum sp. YNF3179]|uniref:phage tail tape measure protein n=1 Tax=Rhodovulum sp. YNF3179 TaxID=3425127 RepID=UPI003D351786